MGRQPTPIADRLINRSKFTSAGCLEWTGRKDRWGYGLMKIGGRHENGGKLCLVHRVAHETWVGPIPNGSFVLHRCDNPACIRIAHLWLGTHQDNMNDMVAKGRSAKGKKNGAYKYWKERRAASAANPNELWMKAKLDTTGLQWTRQAQWGWRLFDFWCHELGIAVEVDGPEHDQAKDAKRDAYNLKRSGILVLRVRNQNEGDAAKALADIQAACTWQERRRGRQ